jgi:hypothetical protein
MKTLRAWLSTGLESSARGDSPRASSGESCWEGAARTRVVAVGTAIADRPPHRSVRAALPHTAPTLDAWRQNARQDKDAEYGGAEFTGRRSAATCTTLPARIRQCSFSSSWVGRRSIGNYSRAASPHSGDDGGEVEPVSKEKLPFRPLCAPSIWLRRHRIALG